MLDLWVVWAHQTLLLGEGFNSDQSCSDNMDKTKYHWVISRGQLESGSATSLLSLEALRVYLSRQFYFKSPISNSNPNCKLKRSSLYSITPPSPLRQAHWRIQKLEPRLKSSTLN